MDGRGRLSRIAVQPPYYCYNARWSKINHLVHARATVDAILYETRTGIATLYLPSTSCFRCLVLPGLCGASEGRDSSSSVLRVAYAKVA
jgi:hypothetical protein